LIAGEEAGMVGTAVSATHELRAEHGTLQRGIADLARLAGEVGDWSVPDTPDRLRGMRGFLYGRVLPHAEAEEAVLYPLMDKVMGAAGTTSTMVADHREIHHHADALVALLDAIGQGPPHAGQVEAVRQHLYALWAILRLHLAKEEDILFPILDARLSEADAETLYAKLAAFGHSG
jgi:iron-sulfur cluster repair protein YtfE (RIC family)